MKNHTLLVLFVLFCLFGMEGQGRTKTPRILVFSKTLGYRHQNIPDGIRAIQKLGTKNNFIIDATENSEDINSRNLKKYQAIVFLSPTGEFFNDDQKTAFQRFIRSGGGFVGIHAASDCLFEWPWYGEMIGAYFKDHPKPQNAVLTITDTSHPSSKNLISPWKRFDEWYNFRSINPKIKTLLEIDESSYEGGKNAGFHPIAWYHGFEGGRIFYTGLGHTPESFTSDDMFLDHVLGGIKYALNVKQ